MKSLLFATVLLLNFLSAFSQKDKIDSLKLALTKVTHDTIRCNILCEMVNSEKDEVKWPIYNEELLTLAEKKIKETDPSKKEYKVYQRHLARALNDKGYLFDIKGDSKSALEYYQRSLKIKEELGNKNGIANSLLNIGFIYKSKGNIPQALEYYNKSLKILEELKDEQGIALLLNNMGSIYNNLGDIPKALSYYERSLKKYESVNDKNGIAGSLANLGTVYDNQGDVMKALEYYSKSLKLREETGDKFGIAVALNNIGFVYRNNGDPTITSSKQESLQMGLTKALEYYNKSLQMHEEIGNKQGIASSLNNIGRIYLTLGDPLISSSKEESIKAGYEKALDYNLRGLKIREEMGDKQGIANSLNNVGIVFLKKKNYPKCLEYTNRSMQLSKELGYPIDIRNAANQLSMCYKALGNNKLALENYELYIQMRDSINSQTTRKASIKNQLKYEYEKQAAADSVAHAKESEIKNVELAKQKAEIKAKKNQQYALFGGLFCVCVFGAFMFNRYKVTQKQKILIEHQKEIVEEQKHLVEEKQKEILDSISYAKRIQMAQLPTDKMIRRIFDRL